ncbi:MAG: TetR/AcrR family transcriptional regulator [Lachnospiraceae bacterium]|nr:TetR/AcrR family transcriptional regulator [Candidatus Colinaster equi]
MARKETITKQYLIDTAFLMAKQEGIENVTARKLAAKAGCSTQPIFRLYENMDDLWKEIFTKAVAFFEFFYDKCSKDSKEPFVDLGMGYIKFSRENPQLFKMLFLSENRYDVSMYEILNGNGGIVAEQMNKAKASGCANPGDLFTKMWMFIHGAACMCITKDYDLDDAETLKLLKATYESFK